ncbi:hypothetical protein RRF57_008002 [Xylaria bambusicola]|uniref:Uncharacterized protein n=1 Tax=Xylaria bambusicola TaxID=326684 RepID=A0AAN7ZB47_9PEZI
MGRRSAGEEERGGMMPVTLWLRRTDRRQGWRAFILAWLSVQEEPVLPFARAGIGHLMRFEAD